MRVFTLVARLLIVPSFNIMTACLPGILVLGGPKDVDKEKHFNEYVIEVRALDSSGHPLPEVMRVEVESRNPVAPTADNYSVPLDGYHYIVFPERINRDDIQSLTLTVDGKAPKTIDFATYNKTAVRPASRKEKTLYHPDSMCDHYKPVPGSNRYIEFASFLFNNLILQQAYATSYSGSCTLSFRERDQITVKFEEPYE